LNHNDDKKVVVSNGENKAKDASELEKPRPFESHLVVDEIVKDYVAQGGFDYLEGKGKPLHISNDDILNTILKNSNFLPPWVELQKEIRIRMVATIKKIDQQAASTIISHEIDEINALIKVYNRKVPNSALQKGFVTAENLKFKYSDKWE